MRSSDDGEVETDLSKLRAIRIQPWSEGDIHLLQRLLSDPTMMEHVGGPESGQSIAERQASYQEKGSRQFRIFDEETGGAVGWVGYWELTWRDERVFEIGWSVLPSFQGQGVASSASAQAIESARAEQRLRYLHAFPSVNNGPSNAICRKLGFTLIEECEFEYPPGAFMRVHDWALDLFSE